MRKVFSGLVIIIMVIIGAYVLWHTIKGYFVISVSDGVVYDGLGREVTDSPWWFKLIFRQESWPGVKNSVIDMVMFWVSLGILVGLGNVVKVLNRN